MKYKVFLSIGTVLLLFAACTKDNYEPPKSMLNGLVVYQNQPLGVRSNGVTLELWQPGYAFFNKITVQVDQDGTFSASLFDGDYKLTRLKGNGPWVDNTDTINVSVRGGANVDVPVDPFFIVKTQNFTRTGTTINATITIQRVNTTKPLELVRVYIGQTLITDQNNNNANSQKVAADITDINAPINISVTVPSTLTGKDYAFLRVGVKTVGVGELLYSTPQKVALK